MKKIVKGRIYNTDKAKLIGNWKTKDIPKTDTDYKEINIYKKKSNEYFGIYLYWTENSEFIKSLDTDLNVENVKAILNNCNLTTAYIKEFGRKKE